MYKQCKVQVLFKMGFLYCKKLKMPTLNHISAKMSYIKYPNNWILTLHQ